MPSKVSDRAVTEFLRDALAADGLGVPTLEAVARAAGLLRERQRMAQAKPFRRAKDALGIRSIRDGFGAGGGWSWELPRDPERRAPTPSPIRPQWVRTEQLVPREWIKGVARLEQHRPPPDVPRHRWCQFVDDCQTFIAAEQLASRAAELGWNAMSLFGCWPNYPLSYLGKAGLLWHVNGGRIIEVHRTWAVIDRPVNTSQRIFYRRDFDQDTITLPWMLDLPPLMRMG